MITTLHGDCREMLQALPDQSVQCIVTSPPYYALRRYGADAREIGQEQTPAAYAAAMVAVFREARRVLRDDGTLWLNIGDSYAANRTYQVPDSKHRDVGNAAGMRASEWGIEEKNLLGIPWRLAFGLQDDGWILRADIIWHKPNCMPESVRDRPTRAHEYVFLFSKSKRYFYDTAAIAEAAQQPSGEAKLTGQIKRGGLQDLSSSRLGTNQGASTRNARTVWSIPTQPNPESHYAMMPEELARRCIAAGSAAQACEVCGAPWGRVVERESNWREHKANGAWAGNVGVADNYQNNVHGKGMSHDLGGGAVRDLGFAPTCACENTGSARSVVLDPFGGAGTTGRVAERLQRDAILIELYSDYVKLQERRTDGVQVEMFV